MSQIEVERFLGRVITDANFRSRAAKSLEIACCCEGIYLSQIEISMLSTIDFSEFCQAAETVDGSIRRNNIKNNKPHLM